MSHIQSNESQSNESQPELVLPKPVPPYAPLNISPKHFFSFILPIIPNKAPLLLSWKMCQIKLSTVCLSRRLQRQTHLLISPFACFSIPPSSLLTSSSNTSSVFSPFSISLHIRHLSQTGILFSGDSITDSFSYFIHIFGAVLHVESKKCTHHSAFVWIKGSSDVHVYACISCTCIFLNKNLSKKYIKSIVNERNCVWIIQPARPLIM